MKAQLNTTLHLLRYFGLGWLMFRVGYAVRRRAGLLRRALPCTSWDQQPLASFLSNPRSGDVDRYADSRQNSDARFFFNLDHFASFRAQLSAWDADSGGPIPIADDLEEGIFRFFESHRIHLGTPPNWHHNPVTGDEFPRDCHWTRIGDFAAGDIKQVWEPNRFTWVFPLVRAYWRTGDERYPRLFWNLFDNWRATNPPQQGVNWKCGQEVAIRLMACCFGLYGFADSPETTPQRVARVAQLMAVSAHRIEANLSYALSQQNNHGISEATGLWTVGLLFPEFAASTRWVRMGREAIERQVAELIDEDGAFSQHSVNYQRVMLDACVWAIRLGELNGQPLSKQCRERVARSGGFLWQLQDEVTGQLPRYGQNDGALLLPLTNCEAADYRPIIQSVALQGGRRKFDSGPWDEAALWLLGTKALKKPADTSIRADWHGAAGGYQVLRSDSGHLVTRAPHYRHRPAQADALHADIWWRGQNIALDAGTYSYNAPPPWDNSLASTACHNTVMVDGRNQMERAGRFLWLPWLDSCRTQYATSTGKQFTYYEATHNGYERLPSPVSHRRGILRIDEHWLVMDSLASRTEHAFRLHWLLEDRVFVFDDTQNRLTMSTPFGPYQVNVACSHEAARPTLMRADAASPRGWYAPTYTDRQPALSLELEVNARHVLFVTLLGPDEGAIRVDTNSIETVLGDAVCRVDLRRGSGGEELIPCRIQLTGAIADTLDIDD